MKQISPFRPKTPFRINRRPARSRTEGALALVRLEFERARLDREIATLRHRTAVASADLAAVNDRTAQILQALDVAPSVSEPAE